MRVVILTVVTKIFLCGIMFDSLVQVDMLVVQKLLRSIARQAMFILVGKPTIRAVITICCTDCESITVVVMASRAMMHALITKQKGKIH